MSRKKQAKAEPEKPTTKKEPKGKTRDKIILSIVATDSSFNPIIASPRVDQHGFQPRQQVGWHGRCIHCNSHVYVDLMGVTSATVEHIRPLCDGGHPSDPANLALACTRCNNEKGIRHDKHVGKGGRADEVIAALQEKRAARWKQP